VRPPLSLSPPSRPFSFSEPDLSPTPYRLRELSARLTSIEAGLEADRRAGLRPVDPSSSSFAPPTFDLPHASASSTPARPESVELPADTNPLQVLVSTMEQMSREEGEHGMDEDEPAGGLLAGEADDNYDLEELEWRAKNEPRSGRPDAFARQLVSFEDVQIAFTLCVALSLSPFLELLPEHELTST